MTVGMLLANTTSAELTEWQAYRQFEADMEAQRSGVGRNMRGT